MWGLENINYSPDPRYFNLTHLLWELGFRNSTDIKDVLKGTNLYLMGRVYMNMVNYEQKHGAVKLVNDMANYEGDIVNFKPEMKTNSQPSNGGRKKFKLKIGGQNGNKPIIPKDPVWERRRQQKEQEKINVLESMQREQEQKQKEEQEEEIPYYEPIKPVEHKDVKRDEYKEELIEARKKIDELLKKEAEKNG